MLTSNSQISGNILIIINCPYNGRPVSSQCLSKINWRKWSKQADEDKEKEEDEDEEEEEDEGEDEEEGDDRVDDEWTKRIEQCVAFA